VVLTLGFRREPRRSDRQEHTVETKFRPVPLSIIDFLGVLVPGFVWLILIVTLLQIATRGASVVTPLTAWEETRAVAESGAWFGPLALIFLAVTTGYGIKARPLRIANLVGAPTLWLFGHRKYALADLVFPYTKLLSDEQSYKAIAAFITEITTFKLSELPANQPFSTAKRLLRLKAPPLWEECEHREAEVRLVGTLCAAALFSTMLAGTELIRECIWYSPHPFAIAWLALSVVLMVALADAFNHIRVREVQYAYLNTIIAFNGDARGLFVNASTSAQKSVKEED
jgi:hypothetical protein